MISQVVEFNFVLGSERFFFKLVLKQRLSASSSQALYWHWSGGSSNNCVAVTLVLLTPCRSELGCDVLADLTDVLQRQLVQYSSNLRSVCNFFSKYNRILNCARFWEKTGEKLGTDLAVVLVSKVRFCITGNVASSSSVVVILAKKKPFDCIRKSWNSRWLEGKQQHLSYIPCNESAE